MALVGGAAQNAAELSGNLGPSVTVVVDYWFGHYDMTYSGAPI
jgi:hypothetical protein